MSAGESDRYSRQISYPKIGLAGQEKIRAASVAIVGCGALGSFAAEALSRAGVGRIDLIDRDYVDQSNLQRQFLYSEADANAESPKAVAASRRLKEVNSSIDYRVHVADLTPSNAEELLGGADVVVDGTDNFETRYLVNDVCVKHAIPWVYGAAVASYGVAMPVWPGHGPCLACVYPEPPAGIQPTCDVNGVIAPATASVAALQVAMTLRFLVGWSDFQARIHSSDVWDGTSRLVSAGPRDVGCPVCEHRQFRFLDGRRSAPVSLCGRNAVQLHVSSRPLDLQELASRLRPLGTVRVNEFALRMELPKYQVTFFPDGRAIVKGTTDIGTAKGIYAQLVGA